MANANLNIKITTNASEASNDIKSFSKQIESISKPIEQFKSALNSWFAPLVTVKGIIDGVAGSIQKYQDDLNKLIDAYKPQWEAETKLKALLQNTNEQLGLNSESLTTLAKSFQNCTTYSDETVLSIESMLVSTNAISKVNMEKAVESVLNISTAMGTDAVGSAKTLAEVLKKPQDELNKLKSVGISFTDAEKEKIAQLTEANDLFEAQRIVLGKVETAYGGLAKAMADTPLGAREQLENLKKEYEQIKGQIALLEEETTVNRKVKRQEKKNAQQNEELIMTAGLLKPDDLLNQPLDTLESFAKKYSVWENSPIANDRIVFSNVQDAIDKKLKETKTDEVVGDLVAKVNVKVEPQDDGGTESDEKDKIISTLQDKIKSLEDEINGKKDLNVKINIATSYLDGVSDTISAWCDFASQMYDNQLTNLNNMLSKMTSAWDEYYSDLKDKHKDESESLIAEYATGRISAEDYYNAKKEMSDELEKAEEDNKKAKEKAQAQVNEIEKKKFIADKANSIANATISMATGIMNAWTNPLTAPIMTALIAATGIAQIATISAQQFTPSFASGAIVNKPTHAIVGDSGYPEAIIPLNKADDLGLTQSKKDGEINITVNIENAYTAEDLAKSVYDSIAQLKKDGILKKEIF